MAKRNKEVRDRRRGRRQKAGPETTKKFRKQILTAHTQQRKAENQIPGKKKAVADRCFKAMQGEVGVEEIGKIMDLSRQMIYRLVKEQMEKSNHKVSTRRGAKSRTTKSELKKEVAAAIKDLKQAEAKIGEQKNNLAKHCYNAMEAGVETNAVSEWLGLSRQMLYKIVRERVFGKTPSGALVVPAGKRGVPKSAKGKAAKAKPKKTKAAPKKASTKKAKKTPSKKTGKGMQLFAKRPKQEKGKEAPKKKFRRPVKRSKTKAAK